LFAEDIENLTWDNCELHQNSSNYFLCESKQESYNSYNIRNPHKSQLVNNIVNPNNKKNSSP